jgi:hypothetical protein
MFCSSVMCPLVLTDNINIRDILNAEIGKNSLSMIHEEINIRMLYCESEEIAILTTWIEIQLQGISAFVETILHFQGF